MFTIYLILAVVASLIFAIVSEPDDFGEVLGTAVAGLLFPFILAALLGSVIRDLAR